MVIAYKMMPATWHLLRRMANQPWVGLTNVLAREFLVPELLQDAATPQALADALCGQLDEGSAKQRLQQRFLEMHHALLRDTAQQSAEAIMQVIASSSYSSMRS